jgi:vacuolar-type H+-ATPase subunit H
MSRKRTVNYQSKEGKQIKELREQKYEQIVEISDYFKKRYDELIEKEKMFKILDSVSEGLYHEIDKLSKKSPIEPVTNLIVDEVNEIIKGIKEIIETDPFIKRLKLFVAAGDNPETRDVLIILKNVRQGIDRYKPELKSLKGKLTAKRHEARLISRMVLLLFRFKIL